MATDNFNRSDETPVAGNYTNELNSHNLSGNKIVPAGVAGYSLTRRNAETYSNAQSSEVKIVGLLTTTYVGPSIRIANGAATGYIWVDDGGGTSYLQVLVAGSPTGISTAGSSSVNDFTKLDVDSGGNLTCYRNGSSVLTASDSTVSSGYAGFAGYAGGAPVTTAMDDLTTTGDSAGSTVSAAVATASTASPVAALSASSTVAPSVSTTTSFALASALSASSALTAGLGTTSSTSLASALSASSTVNANLTTTTTASPASDLSLSSTLNLTAVPDATTTVPLAVALSGAAVQASVPSATADAQDASVSGSNLTTVGGSVAVVTLAVSYNSTVQAGSVVFAVPAVATARSYAYNSLSGSLIITTVTIELDEVELSGSLA